MQSRYRSVTNYKWIGAGLVFSLCLLWLAPELALAGNKFETIGGGVSGSVQHKMEYVRWFGIGFGSFFLIAGLLSFAGAFNHNALMMNYVVWKKAGIIWLILSALAFGMAIWTTL